MQETQVMRVRSWFGKILWRGKWWHTPVLLPGKFHGQRSWRAPVRGVAQSRPLLSTHTAEHRVEGKGKGTKFKPHSLWMPGLPYCLLPWYFLYFIYLAAQGLSCSMQTLSLQWDLVPWPGIKRGSIESMKSQPTDHQGSPFNGTF